MTVKSVITKVVTKVEGKVHSVVTKVESKVLHAIDEVWHKVGDLTEGDMDFDFDIRISKNLEGKERVQPLRSLQGTGCFPRSLSSTQDFILMPASSSKWSLACLIGTLSIFFLGMMRSRSFPALSHQT
jgi:hypothetical protein